MSPDTLSSSDDGLFISDIDSASDQPQKRRRTRKDEISSDSDTDFSDWEDVALDIPEVKDSFNITLGNQEDKKRKEKLQDAIRSKKNRINIHYLGMLSYMMHASHRNKWLSSKILLKKLKKLLPDSFMNTRFKDYKRMQKKLFQNPTNKALKEEAYSYLINTIKYLIKWFRLNYKCDSNGLRVLGYLPKNVDFLSVNDYFPNTSKPISDLKDFVSIGKKFRHNRDTGAQIFTALMRSLGFQSRLVFSLPLLSTSKDTNTQPKLDHEKLQRNKDFDLLYPYFWTEIVNPLDESELFIIENICFIEEEKRFITLRRINDSVTKEDLPLYYTENYFPIKSQFNQMSMHYVISLDDRNLIMDVSPRYMQDVSYRYFHKLDLRTESGRATLLFQSMLRYLNKQSTYSNIDNLELDTLRHIALLNYNIPLSFSSMKKNPNLVTRSTLRYNEIIDPNAIAVCRIKMDKMLEEPVFFKNSILVGKSEQRWKFLGRSIKEEQINSPILETKVSNRRRRRICMNILSTLPESNDTKLYCFSQTCPYVNLKVVRLDSGALKLPRNEYGNIEIFRPSMIPEKCTWLRLSNIEDILFKFKAGKLDCAISDEIEYVSVVTGFSFTNRGQAVPIKQGVLVLELQAILSKKIWLFGKIQEHKLECRNKNLRAMKNWKEILRRLRTKSELERRYGKDI